MKQLVMCWLAAAALSGVSYGDVIVQYGSVNGVTNLAASAVDSHVTAADLTAGAGIAPASGGTWNWKGWEIDNASYADALADDEVWTWGFTVDANGVDLTTMDLRVDRSGTGPDDFEINAVVTPNGDSAGAPILLLTYDYFDSDDPVNFLDVDLTAIASLAVGDSIEFSLAAFNSEGSIGTFDLEVVSGSESIIINGVVAGGTPSLSVVLGKVVIFEDAPTGVGMHTGTVSRSGDLTNAVTVSIVSDDLTAATVDATVIIPAAAESASFEYEPVTDALVDNAQIATFDFTALGYNPTSAEVTVLDDEASTSAVVINEFLYRNVNDPDSEFVELFNDTGGVIDLQGWKVEIYDADVFETSYGSVVASVTIPTGAPVMVADQGFYLIGNNQFQTTYSIVPDLLATIATETDSVTVALFDQLGNLVFNANGTDGAGRSNIGGSEYLSDGVYFPLDVLFGPDGAFPPAGYRFLTDGGGSFELLEYGPQPSPSGTPGATNVLAPELVLTITPGSVDEDDGASAATATVTRLYGDTSGALVLTLSEDDGDDSEISIPASVTIMENQVSESFGIEALIDGITDGPQVVTITVTDGGAVFSSVMAQVTVKDVDVVQFTDLVINEIDADQTGTDAAEFIELYNLTGTAQSLDGLVLVLFNGAAGDDVSCREIDLDGHTIPANGFFLIGHAATVANVDLDFVDDLTFPASGVLQNGPDAVALFVGDASDFPNATPAATWVGGATLVDAIVYGTGDPEDTALLATLSQAAQLDESANSSSTTESISRDGDGGSNFVTQPPTPGATNGAAATVDPLITGISLLDPSKVRIIFVGNANQTYVLKSDPDLQSDFLTSVTATGGSLTTDGSGDGLVDFSLVPGALYFRIEE